MFLNSLLSAYFDRIPIGDKKYYAYEDVWMDYATKTLTNVFMYLAIALAVILIGIGIFVKMKKSEAFHGYIKMASGIVGGFIVTVIVIMLTLGYMRIFEKGYNEYEMILNYVLIPSSILAGIAVIGIIAGYVTSLISPKAFKIALIAFAATFGAMLITLLVLLGVYFSSGNAENNNWEWLTSSENIWLYVSAAILVVVIAALAIVFGLKKKNSFDSKAIAYAAVCIAMSFALSYIKFWEMPQGGSLTLASLVPLMLYSYMFGTKKGVLAGLVYGVLQAIQDPWLIHPAQFLLDYPIAFAAIGLAGIFADLKALDKLPQVKFALGAIVAAALRFAAHVLSGVFAFNSYAGEEGAWIYSLGYNSFVWPDIAIAIVVGVLLLSVRAFKAQVKKIQADNTKKDSKPSSKEVTAE